MRRTLIALSLCAFGCTSQESLPDAPLIAALVDLHLAQARQQLVGDLPEAFRDSILSRHGFDPARFEASLRALETDLEHANATYSAVVDSLNARGLITSEAYRPKLTRP